MHPLFNPKFVVICGPTASGKTALALHLARRFNADILSADSRQVYTQMDWGTGKDIPKNYFKKLQTIGRSLKVPVYQHVEAPEKYPEIYGYDLALPSDSWSVGQYVAHAAAVFNFAHQQKKQIIVVGGTGLYLKSLFNPPQTLLIKPDDSLRQKLNQLSLSALKRKLRKINITKWNQMNHSDQENPRRLIRAIEVSLNNQSQVFKSKITSDPNSIIWLALKPNPHKHKALIKQRVIARANQQFTQEIALLEKKFPDFWRLPAASAIGYREWSSHLASGQDYNALINIWTLHELQYAKRQLVWFKKMPGLRWLDPYQPNFESQVVTMVKNWYASTNEPSSSN